MITPRNMIDAQDVQRHYDQLDEFYRELWGDHIHHGLWNTGRERTGEAIVRLIEVVADAAGVCAGSRVCDIGCGYGGTSRHLVSTRHALLTGYTISESQFRYARQRLCESENPSFRLCRWEQNGLLDKSMDAAVSIECFTHVPDKLAFLREIYRVLKPGGRAALTVWMHREHPRAWQVRHLLEPICHEGRLAGLGTSDEYRELIEASGLVLDDHQDWSKQVRKTWWICLRRLTGRIFTSSRYRRALRDHGLDNRVFAITLLRILIAYQIGVMRYGFFSLRRPGHA